MNKIETILHPVRYKIIQQFMDGRSRTAKILANELKSIPQATLYRQLDALVKAGVLQITEENQIRGTVEKVYSLNVASAIVTNDDIKNLTKEEHLQYFLLFTAQLARDFENYLQKEEIDFERDGISYRQMALHLADNEFFEFVNELKEVYSKYSKYEPAENRTTRLVSNIFIPKKKEEL